MSYAKYLKAANKLRDSGRHREAVEAYRAALREDGHDPRIWVQLGNMLKDTHAYDEAIEAYRMSLTIDDRNADCWVQIGRAFKLQGKREEALSHFSRALRLDIRSRDAANELMGLGDSWAIQEVVGLGVPLQQELLSTVLALRGALDSVLDRLPAIESITSFARQSYSLFRHIHKVAPPPRLGSDEPIKLGIVIIDEGAPLTEVYRCAASIAEINQVDTRAILLSSSSDCISGWNRLAVGAESRLLNGRRLDDELPCSAMDKLGPVDWVLICRHPAIFCKWIADWITWTSSNTAAVATFMDEDKVDRSEGQVPFYREPKFGSVFDQFMPKNSYLAHGAVAVRREAIRRLSDHAVGDIDQWWISLVEKLSNEGPIAHIPRVLVTQLASDSNRADTSILASAIVPADQQVRISVIVPTKNMQPFLERCISSLLETASNKRRVEILIVDNGSDDPLTLAYLNKQAELGSIRKIVVDEPFNWSRLNNIAVGAVTSDIVVFANNDLEMRSFGWDDAVVRGLQDGRVGAIGARLVYPDNTIQHAGILFGIAGSTEHEGRGQISTENRQDRIRMRRSVSAVTGAFMACRRSDFSGFDERLPIAFNDVDFCLLLRSRGMHIVYEPDILAVHYESKSLAWAVPSAIRGGGFEVAKQYVRQKWGAAFQFDPSVNPHFANWGRPLEYIREPSLTDILDYVRWSAQSSPWKVPSVTAEVEA